MIEWLDGMLASASKTDILDIISYGLTRDWLDGSPLTVQSSSPSEARSTRGAECSSLAVGAAAGIATPDTAATKAATMAIVNCILAEKY